MRKTVRFWSMELCRIKGLRIHIRSVSVPFRVPVVRIIGPLRPSSSYHWHAGTVLTRNWQVCADLKGCCERMRRLFFGGRKSPTAQTSHTTVPGRRGADWKTKCLPDEVLKIQGVLARPWCSGKELTLRTSGLYRVRIRRAHRTSTSFFA